MISSNMRQTHKQGSPMGSMVFSAAGCFALMRSLKLVASGQERLVARSPMQANGRSTKSSAGISAALLLLAFVASQALVIIVALRH
jgi:hypothetical protein